MTVVTFEVESFSTNARIPLKLHHVLWSDFLKERRSVDEERFSFQTSDFIVNYKLRKIGFIQVLGNWWLSDQKDFLPPSPKTLPLNTIVE